MEDAEIIKILSEGYNESFGDAAAEVTPLPRSGSDRRYFRFSGASGSIIGAHNANHEENEAFIGFTHHFRGKSLPVPEYMLTSRNALSIFSRIWAMTISTPGFTNDPPLLHSIRTQ